MEPSKWPLSQRERLYFLKDSMAMARAKLAGAATVAYIPPFRDWIRLLVVRILPSPSMDAEDILEAIVEAGPEVHALYNQNDVNDPKALNRLFVHYYRLYNDYSLWLNNAPLPLRCQAMIRPNTQCPQNATRSERWGRKYCNNHLQSLELGEEWPEASPQYIMQLYPKR